MAELLQNWLNQEIELSRTVEHFEKDFANGYLLGELLYKFNQQPNFHEFNRKDDVAAKIANFNLLQPTLRNLKIKFNSNFVDSIMKEERGAALRLLYQLRMALEKVYPPTDYQVLSKTGKIGDNRPAMKIPAPKEKYEAQEATFFQNRLQVLNKPQKQILMERHLKKFDDEQIRQAAAAKAGDNAEKGAKEKHLLELRAAGIAKVQRNAGFMEEWLQKGVEDWKKNQSIKKDRERKDLEFEYKETEKYHQLALRKIDEATKEVNDGIAQFEQTLKKNYGISTKVNKQEAERAVSQSISNGGSPLRNTQKTQRFSSVTGGSFKVTSFAAAPALVNPFANSIRGPATTLNQGNGPAMTLTSTGLRSKDKKVVSDAQKKERERRRRKMIVDQMQTYQDMENKRRQDQVLERMKWQSKQEEELVYEKWRTEQCKNVIIDNRKLREARYEKRREIDTQTAQWREEEMLKSLKDQTQREIETLKDRDHEMRILGKQAHRERRNEFGASLFDAIFEIANEAYIHQQESDTNDIDSRNWHEWLQLFVEEMPIEGTLSKLAELSSDAQEPSIVDPHEKLDEMELVDYLKNQGQWTKDIITENPPNLEQFLTGQADSAPVAAGGKAPAKGAPAKAASEAITLEEGDADLPAEAPNNYQLGDAIEQIVCLNYEARARQRRQKVPQSQLNLKIAFIGYAFAGKKTQAEVFCQQYGLQGYQMSDLVGECLAAYEAHPEPYPAPEINSAENEEKYDTLSEDSELEEVLNPMEDFRACGEKIADLLKDGLEITDEVYVQLYVAKLRLTYPHKSKKQLRQELRVKVEKQREIRRKIEPLQKELNDILEGQNPNQDDSAQTEVSKPSKKKHSKDANYYRAKIEELQKESDKLDDIQRNGWILIDFPSTFAQAKLLETALSGFVPRQEQEAIDREQELENAFLLVQPTAKEAPPKTLIKSGLDAVIWFDLSREECMRRALGRRFDPEEEKMYHVWDVPPPTDQAPLCERLVVMDEDHNSEATLIDRWISFDQGRKALENWLLQFGEQSTGRCILYKLQADESKENVSESLRKILDEVREAKKAKELLIKEKINASIDAKELLEQEKAQKEKEEEEEKKKRELEGGDEIPKKADESGKPEKPEPATERVPPKDAGVSNIDNDFKPTVLKVWQELSHNYKGQMKNVFRQVRTQRERIIATFSHMQKQYLEFIHRPDTKQEKLEQFIKDFNDFSDQFPDLREDEATKDELHQRVDILSDELWEIIEERKEQHVEERKKIMESGWVEHELSFMVTSALSLMQSEVDKFKSSIQILHDYYHAFEDKLIPEAPPLITQDLIVEGEELPAVESLNEGADPLQSGSYSYPRLDKIFEKALKTQFVADVTLAAAGSQDKKAAAPAKGAKDPKKPAEDDKPIEDSHYVKEMRSAIKVEKSILRYRLTQVRNWALKRLRDIRSKAIKVYTKLEDWIHVANKAENDSVDEMCVVLKRAIEEERKIQDELRIKFMDFCVDEEIMNYIEPPPEKLPAMEQVRKDRFNIKQLRTIVSELEELASQHSDGNGGVPNKLITDLLLRKLENSKTLWDDGSLPEEWWNLKEYDFANLVRNLDRSGTGTVNWRQLATFIILLQSHLPTDKDIENYKKVAGGELVSKDAYLNIPAWFDETEFSQDREYSIPFPRVAYIKELLFTVNKEFSMPENPSEERLSMEALSQMLLSARDVIQGNIVKKADHMVAAGVRTYGAALFMQSNLPNPNAGIKKQKKLQ